MTMMEMVPATMTTTIITGATATTLITTMRITPAKVVLDARDPLEDEMAIEFQRV